MAHPELLWTRKTQPLALRPAATGRIARHGVFQSEPARFNANPGGRQTNRAAAKQKRDKPGSGAWRHRPGAIGEDIAEGSRIGGSDWCPDALRSNRSGPAQQRRD